MTPETEKMPTPSASGRRTRTAGGTSRDHLAGSAYQAAVALLALALGACRSSCW